MSIEKFKKDNILVEEFKVNETDKERLRILIKCVDYCGDDWSLLQLLGILYVRIMKWFKKEVKNPWPMGWICTEVIWEFLQELGIEITEDRETVGVKVIRDALMNSVVNLQQQGRWSVYEET